MKNKQEFDMSLTTSKLYTIISIMSLIILGCFYVIFKIFDIEKGHTSLIQDLLFFSVLILSFFVHELIHYFTFLYFIKSENRNSLKLGFSSKYLAPYCYCSKMLEINKYRWAGIMPFVLLSFIPTLIAVITSSYLLLFFGLISTVGCTGDLYMLYRLRIYKNGTMIKDHPSKIGCTVYLND